MKLIDPRVSGDAAQGRARRRLRNLLLATALGGSLLAAPVLAPMFNFSAVPALAGEPLSSKVDEQPRAPLSFAGIVKKVRPAVVSIQVSVEAPAVANRFSDMPQFRDLPQDHPFNEFFRRFFGDEMPGNDDKRQPRHRFGMAQGSGFIISEDGYVVTNNHVVENAAEIKVAMDDGTEYTADLIGTDPKTDLALLKLKTNKTLPYVAFAKNDVEIGDWVVAVGNPFGLGGSVTAGIVSARGRDIGSGPYDDFIQIDAPINRGNSGGPAFNLDGEVIGINTAIFSPSGGSVGIGFAIPANVATQVVAQLKDNGSVSRGWLGVQIQPVTDDIAESLGLSEAKGAIVSDITADSPAEKAGIEEGDTILQVNGRDVKDAKDLARKVAALSPNSIAKLAILRDGKNETLNVTLGQQTADRVALASPAASGESKMDDLGLTLAPSSDVPGSVANGVVVVGVEDGSEAAEKGLQVGDVIVEVGGKTVTSPKDVVEGFKTASSKDRKAVLMRVQSGERQRFVALPVKKA